MNVPWLFPAEMFLQLNKKVLILLVKKTEKTARLFVPSKGRKQTEYKNICSHISDIFPEQMAKRSGNKEMKRERKKL